jgi:hypothetical protein
MTADGNRRYAAERARLLAGRGDPQSAGRLTAAQRRALAARADKVAPRSAAPTGDAMGQTCECTGTDPLPHLGANHVAIGQGRGRPVKVVCSMGTTAGMCPCPEFRPRPPGRPA